MCVRIYGSYMYNKDHLIKYTYGKSYTYLVSGVLSFARLRKDWGDVDGNLQNMRARIMRKDSS